MERAVDKRLQDIINSGAKLYSISKLNTVDNCLYEAYQTYILGDRGDSSVYGELGGAMHDCLEDIMNDRKTKEDLLPAMQDKMDELEMFGVDFPLMNGSDIIKRNWLANMTHFCKNFIKPQGKFATEELCIYKLSDKRYCQGYIDLMRFNEDGTISIYDWKTSSKFKRADLEHHGRQLILYALALEQAGQKVKDLHWIMLKYCDVYQDGKVIKKQIDRKKLWKEIQGNVKVAMINSGYDDADIEMVMMTNDFADDGLPTTLPADVHNKFSIQLSYVEYPLTDAKRQECINYINQQADLFESLENAGESAFKPALSIEEGDKNDMSFFCNNLCGHGKHCKYLKQYNEAKAYGNKATDEDDLF